MKTTTKKMMALAAITSAVLLTGCQKDLYDPDYVASKNGLLTGVPSDFNWSTISSVNLTVNVDDKYNGEYYYVVEVFDSNPVIDSNAKLLTKGVAKKGQAFSTEFSIPQTLKNIAIRQTDPTGITITRVVDVASNITLDFASSATKSVSTRSSNSTISTKSISVAESDFANEAPAGAISYTTDNDQNNATNLKLNNGFNQSINLWLSDKNLYASGKVHITNLSLASGCKLYILPNAEVTLDNNNNFTQSGIVISINSGGKLILNGNTEIGYFVKLLNKGTIEVANENSNIKVSSNGQLYNAGTINLTGTLSGENDKSFIDNYGTITAKNFLLNGNSSMTNAGNINITNQASITSTFAVWRNESGTFTAKNMEIYGTNLNSFNACKLIVTEYLNMYDCKLVVDAGAYVSCKTLYMNNARVELGTNAILKVEDTATYGYNPGSSNYGIYGPSTGKALLKIKKAIQNTGSNPIIHYGGCLQIECQDHPSSSLFTEEKTVEWVPSGGTSFTIKQSGCSEGNTAAKGETPTSPKFPITVEPSKDYTFAMEDSWPSYGDYDMNDLVTTIKTGYEMNTSNQATKMIFNVNLRAVGALKSIGAAIQLDNVLANNIAGVTYEGTKSPLDGSVFEVNEKGVETGQSKAVIPFFDNAHKFLNSTGITNTIFDKNKVPSQSVKITITFNSPISVSTTDIQDLNFFIVTDGKKSSRTEIHLAGYNPTDKFNSSLFGTGDDNSVNGTKFTSKDQNLVWGMLVPTVFSYPIEYKNIQKAYTAFGSWAKSKGANNQEWYKTPKTGTTF